MSCAGTLELAAITRPDGPHGPGSRRAEGAWLSINHPWLGMVNIPTIYGDDWGMVRYCLLPTLEETNSWINGDANERIDRQITADRHLRNWGRNSRLSGASQSHIELN